jgi:hypothetical protein
MGDPDQVIPVLEADLASFFKASSADGNEWTFLVSSFADTAETEPLKKLILHFRGTILNAYTLLPRAAMRQHHTSARPSLSNR